MDLIKRSLEKQKFDGNKLLVNISKLSNKLDGDVINPQKFIEKIESGICDQMSTVELTEYMGETAASCMSIHPDFGILASRIIVAKIHKETLPTFSGKVEYLHKNSKYISEDFYKIVMKYADTIDHMMDYSKDNLLTYFGLQTLRKSYLLKVGGVIVERPQDVFMRVAIQIHKEDTEKIRETYNLMSNRYLMHATPSLFNSGTPRQQMSSCFLITIKDDSAKGIFDTLHDAVNIAKFAGGLGINASHIRSRGSPLSTGGHANGLIAMCKVFESMTKFISQCGNKRVSSVAFYLEPWHPEIFEFLDLRKNTGKDEMRARSLFTALWIPDLFMRRVERNENWSLFCPNIAKGLNDVYGEEFDKLYIHYENMNLATRVVPAQKIWRAIVEAQIETGTPFLLYKDAANIKSNQRNLGTIKCSNLCAEILEYTTADEIAVCNLGSLALPTFIDNGVFNFEKLKYVAKVLTTNLDKVIDINYYPVKEAAHSNLKHRPIGVGVQGLADVFAILRLPFDSDEAKKLNKDIFETIYYGAVEASNDLAKIYGPYESFQGSPSSKGLLQFDLWGVKPEKYNWGSLKADVMKYGLRNSLLTALMPTASTSQILGYNECFEPFTTNIYTRRTLAGEFQVLNSYLIRDLIKLDVWSPEIKNQIIKHDGSIQNIKGITDEIKFLYRNVWELKMKAIIDMSADRGAYIDQTQSLNLFIAEPSYGQVTSMHFYGWRKGLKTGMYYMRTRPISSAIKFTVDEELLKSSADKETSSVSSCSLDENCESCSA